MRQDVLAHGKLLFCKDSRALANLKPAQLREYQDYIMLELLFRRYRKRSIEGGTFGRRSDNGAQVDGTISPVPKEPRCVVTFERTDLRSFRAKMPWSRHLYLPSASLSHQARQQFVRMQSRFMIRHQILDHDLSYRQIPGESPQLLPHLLDGAADKPGRNAAT